MAKPFKKQKLLLLGSGELGKEVTIEAKRLGCDVIACDRYEGAPAMQVASRSYVFPMLEGENIRRVVEKEKPDFIVPEIEAIATQTLVELEKEGWDVIPTATAARTTMNREGIRRLAAEKLKLPTSPYRFASNLKELEEGARAVGFPCFIKPTMSSSGHGQSMAKKPADLKKAWEYAMEAARGKTGKVIVEGRIDFDYEITLLTVRHTSTRDSQKSVTSFCEPIGHIQIDGDYRESWQPHTMSKTAHTKARLIAKKVTDALGGRGIFGVELFIKGDTVYFSEVSPRPHDTGMVTMISQNMSEMELHVRAILSLPIPTRGGQANARGGQATIQCQPGASAAILSEVETNNPAYEGVREALSEPGVAVRIFGKPVAYHHRRMAVALATGKTVVEARKKAMSAAKRIKVVKG